MASIKASGDRSRGRGFRRVPLAAEVLEGRQLLSTITVTSSGDADGADGSQTLSLRQAIEVSNGTLAVSSLTATQQALVVGASTTPNTIDFNIPGTGPFTIKPATALPKITAPVTIDGYTQAGAAPGTAGSGSILEIGLDFSSESGGGGGLDVAAAGSTVEGLALAGAQSGAEITLDSGSTTAGSTIEGDFIGTDTTGLVAPANKADGISSSDAFDTIGGYQVSAYNVISGNAIDGILLTDGSGDVVEGNDIGTDPGGTKAVPNQGDGVHVVGGSGNSIGATSNFVFGGAVGNLISGNLKAGIELAGAGSPTTKDSIAYNDIGTDLTGRNALANGGDGILITGATDITIGGIFIPSFGTQEADSPANTIADNGGAGVGLVPASTGVVSGINISENSISGNGGLGIDLGGDGVTPNNPAGSPTGPNLLQPYPVLTPTGGQTVDGTLTALPSTTYTLQFFSSPAPDASGFGQGKTFVYLNAVTTNASGVATFTIQAPAYFGTSANPADNESITATATDAAGNTSEFSNAALVLAPGLQVPVASVDSTVPVASQGQPVTFVGVVAATGAGTPTGLVGFVVDGSVIGFAPLNSLGIATFTTDQLMLGTHSVTLAYLGDSSHPSTFSASFSQQVTQPAPLAVVYSTTPLNAPDEPVTFVGVVAATGTGTPTGLVGFVVDGSVIGFAPLNSLGIATFTTDQLALGTYSVTLAYLGDATHASTFSAAYAQQIVTPYELPAPVLTVTSTNPKAKAGTSVTFVGTASATDLGIPTGLVVLLVDGLEAGTAELNAQGAARFTTKTLAVGTHLIILGYVGDATHAHAYSPIITQQIVSA